MIRPSIGASLLALAAAGPALAQETWYAAAYSDENGRPFGTLTFGVPETDNVLLSAVCHPDSAGMIDLMLYMGTGTEDPGDDASVTFTTGGIVETIPATVDGSSDSETGPYFTLSVDRADRLWETLMAGSSTAVSANGGQALTVSLRGTRAAIGSFLDTCDTIAVAHADPGPGPLEGPLFIVGTAPARALTALDGGAALPAFRPGTELMATNVTGRRDGTDWLEVRTDRGAGVTAWVERAALVPTSGGASAYQNLNVAANLLLRASPSATAATVGTIPPGASGIADQGQRQGNWVLVRYGAATGWASHDYLVPLLAPTGDDGGGEDEIGGDAGPIYDATFGSWHASCDPCASVEDPMCAVTSGGLPQAITAVADDARPGRIGDIRIGMDLEQDAAAGTLSIMVDGVQAAAIPPRDLTYMGMTGEFLIAAPYLKPVLGAMSRGRTVSVIFAGASGETQSFSLPLGGFPDAVAGMLEASPGFPRDAACRF